MIRVGGIIRTAHADPACVAGALAVDNLKGMETRAAGHEVITELSGTQLRSIIASVDDYLMNLAIAEDVCCYVST